MFDQICDYYTEESAVALLNWFLKIWMMLKDNVGSSHVKDLNGSSVEMSTSPFTDLFLINVQFEMGWMWIQT